MHARLPVLVVLAALLTSGSCAGQSANGDPPSRVAPPDTGAKTPSSPAPSTPVALQARSKNAVSVWIAGSFATGGPIGNLPKARLGLLGLRYERLLVPTAPHSPNGPSLTYTADLLPVLLLSIPPEAISGSPVNDAAPIRTRGLNAYGIGFNPAGLRLTYRVTKRVQPFLRGSTGLTYFTESVPTEWGKRLNFMFDLGAGIQFVLTSDLRLTAGYRYHHLSNGFRGQINPGVDASLLHLGLSFSQ
ncbi:MAG: acyloxyacyl hydrolase [Salinibacter sp.]